MKIIGWVRSGDKTACGGTVIEGDVTCISYGRPYAFEGARVSCHRYCVIANGYPLSTVNGRAQVLHGMKTNGGCPIYSTLNGIDGVGDDSGTELPVRFVKDKFGDWSPRMNDGYDQHFLVTDDVTGTPLAGRRYRMVFNGKTIEGQTDADGRTQRVSSDDPAEVTIEVMPEGYTGGAGV
ncbi:PAAR domain-containing protein [uncultured Herbaspirillum sp.]|uniref:PAAR domain-containing protein n=1 Tax=uncultured Herbaspirillum sp. TaxID=160236 RepID=UPI002585657D|nr:PAAR domain-containing protein [uncultured Herbaspirillum sp.]